MTRNVTLSLSKGKSLEALFLEGFFMISSGDKIFREMGEVIKIFSQ